MKVTLSIFFFGFVISVYAQNYDETKVPSFVLPDVLQSSAHGLAKNKTAWEKWRRPEVITLFEDNVYGRLPKEYDSIKFTIRYKDAAAMAGKAHLKEVAIKVWRLNKFVTLHLHLFIPNNKRPAPLFLFINNRDTTNTDITRKIKSEFWPAELVVDSGYAMAAFWVADAAPDNATEYQNAALQLYPEVLTTNNGAKAIGAWAWAASRVMDYLVKDQEIDSKKICLVGHSRGGKAALWAGALDRRFAAVFSNCSGNTGAALSRRRFGETVSRINENFPHWFCSNYKKYNNNEDALPIDQHMLLSLIAPRPLYITNASQDLWADPRGSYLALLNAQKVYALYKKQMPLPPHPPPVNTLVTASAFGYHNREGIHDLTAYDWKAFIAFANRHLK